MAACQAEVSVAAQDPDPKAHGGKDHIINL